MSTLVVTFEGDVMTPEGGDEVSEERQQEEAVLSVRPVTGLLHTPAQVRSQGFREGRGDAGVTLRLLNKQHLLQTPVYCFVFF